MASSFTINTADLAFILKQIKIAEDTSIGYTPLTAPKTILQSIMDTYGLSASDAQIAPFGLRTVDGTFNSLVPGQSTFGAADTVFPRLTDPVYRNEGDEPDVNPFGVVNENYGIGGNVIDSDPRIISNLVVDMTAGNAAAVEAALNHSVFKGAIAEGDVPAAAAAIAAAWALTKSTDIAAAIATGALAGDSTAELLIVRDAALALYNAAVAADAADAAAAAAALASSNAAASADTASETTAASVFSGSTITADDIVAVGAAVTAATAAASAAAAVVAALLAHPDGAGHPDYAQAVAAATNATALANQLVTLQGAMDVGESSAIHYVAAATTAALADSNAVDTQLLLTDLTAFVGGDVATTFAAYTAAEAAYTASLNAPAAATAADQALADTLTLYGIEYDSAVGSHVGGFVGSLVIPNLSPDIGLSPGFNSWMTFFGQFFDHGLDLVTKGGNGTVYVPLAADDPLIAGADGVFNTADDLAPHLRFMALTRATPVNGGQENTTTSFVDQNQTYTSDPSHQVFLREYMMTVNGAVSTGKMLDGGTIAGVTGNVAGAIGNWAEVKAQALTMLGIILTDFNVHNAPMLLVDQYGKFIPSATGFAQVVTAVDVNGVPTAWVSGTAGGLDLTSITTQFTGHAFLNDIAHHAAPSFVDHDMDDRNNNGIVDSTEGTTNVAATAQIAQVADSLAGVADDHNILTYDDEMLNAHFITGDGRGNENIALTTVHSIFHSEHNRAVDANKVTLLRSGDLAFLNEWLATDVLSLPVLPPNATDAQVLAIANGLTWDGERLFQAARFTTEMQYQHMVFEEFARRIQPMVDPFIFNTSPDVDPSIVAEFAHTVYRFGHSMLTGTVDRLTNDLTTVDGAMDQATLLAVFLNPQAYIGSGATLDEINGNIIRGLSRDVGNAIDEFIVQDVRSNLLGLPLDLAMFNLSRGRETGIPSLNDTRAQLYNDTGLADLKPYESWADFALNIKNAASVVNFIAAYGTHTSITSVSTLADKRAAAELLVFGGAGAPADRLEFLNGTDAYAGSAAPGAAGTHGGLNFIDLWIGGLAEKNPEFGGMLGTTFNYVFEYQMEALQFGDRMYYLSRTQGTGFLNNLEPNTFSDIVMRNTALGDIYSTHLNGALFTTPDYVIELDRGIAQTDYNGAAEGNDPLGTVVRDYTGNGDVSANGHDEGGYLRVFGGNHYVLGGTEGKDRIYGDSGIDTLWGDGGDDYLNGGTESDDVFGGEGDDVIEDPFGDDVLRGNQGNDVITSARGADLLFGDQGQDYIVLGQDASEVFGGTGDDFILGGMGKDFLLGNEGNDWIEGGGGFDTIAGENSELFFNSPIIGHDVMFGQGDESDYDAESGDDIMVSAPSVVRNEGMFGFDWAIAKNDNSAIKFDLQIPIFTTIPEDVLRDRFDQVEALSGWINSDILDGDDRGHKGGGSSAPDSVPTQLFADHLLTQEGIDRIDGLNAWFAGARNTLFGAATPIPGTTSLPVTTYRDGNILMGGDGNDFLRGRGGYDILDGDAWLNVRIAIHANADGTGPVVYSAESMSSDTVTMGQYAGKVYNVNPDGSPNFASVAFGGASLTSLLLDRTINPGQMTIVREILDGTTGGETDNDTAIFQGNLAEYDVEGRTTDGLNNASGNVLTEAHDVNGDGFISVRDRDTGAVGATINVRDPTTNVITQVTLSSRGALTDDTDLLKNIELLRFADQTIRIAGDNNIATGVVTIGDFDRQFPAQSTTFDLDGLPATPPLVTPYVGQVLTASLSGVNDLDGFGLNPVTFQWQTTEIGSNAGWTTITTGTTYTVRSVDPGHILRAVAVFNDNLGAPETIISAATDGATAAFSVNENATTGTVVASSIPFSPDYDPDQTPGGPTDGDITALTHVLRDNFGGRYQLVTVGGVQQVQVLNGGPVNFDYETNNEHQIVIDSYIDAASAAAQDPAGRIASRQFTVLLNDINPEVVGTPPTDIQWNGVTPGDGITGLGNAANGLPGAGTVIANLSTVDANNDAPYTYALVSSTSPTGAFTVNATTGAVTRTGVALAPNATYTLDISSTDATGGTRVETFTIRTGTNSVFLGANGIDTITAANGTDHIIYGSGANDSLTGAAGNDNLFGQAGNDILNGGVGNDILVGGGGNDTVNGGDGNDTIRYTVDADGNDAVNGGGDNDTLVLTSNGGGQNLTVTLNAGGVITNFEGGTVTNVESVTANLGGGTDTLTYTSATAGVTVNLATGTATGFTSIANIENVTTNGGQDTLTGNGGANVLSGGGAADVINGGGGGDTLNGDGGGDTLNGEAGNDILVGGGGLDIMTGGADNDVFDFNQTTESGNTLAAADVVTDFATGLDDIDVSSIDANLTVGGGGAGGQAFSNAFGANGDAFTAAGQMRFTQVDTDGVGGVDSTLLRFNTDANAGTTEFAILLRGYLNPVVAGDFIL